MFLANFSWFSFHSVYTVGMNYTKFSPKDEQKYCFSFWQSHFWKEILETSWQAKEVFWFGNPESTFFLVEIRSLWFWFFGAFILWLKKNQLSNDYKNCFDELKQFLKKKNILFLQIEPLDEMVLGDNFSQPFKKFLTPYTRTISLEQSIDEILANMSQKWRYAVRNALKKWVEIEFCTQISDEILDEWMLLIGETTKRDKFSHNSREYYETFLKTLEWNMVIAIAKYETKTIAMMISTYIWDEAIYYYWASASDATVRKLAPWYLSLWKTMEFVQGKWAKIYDLLWVADPNDPNDSLAGVSQFKQKLGGELQKLPEKFLFPLSWKFFIYKNLLRIKKFLKK